MSNAPLTTLAVIQLGPCELVAGEERRSATAYRPGRPPKEIPAKGELTGGTVVRGFRVPLAKLFEF